MIALLAQAAAQVVSVATPAPSVAVPMDPATIAALTVLVTAFFAGLGAVLKLILDLRRDAKKDREEACTRKKIAEDTLAKVNGNHTDLTTQLMVANTKIADLTMQIVPAAAVAEVARLKAEVARLQAIVQSDPPPAAPMFPPPA